MKTFNTMEELYEALKPFEPDDAVYLHIDKNSVSILDVNNKVLIVVIIKHDIEDYRRIGFWKIPRPVDLTKYIGKVCTFVFQNGWQEYYKLTDVHLKMLERKEIKSIEPLTSEDICPANE